MLKLEKVKAYLTTVVDLIFSVAGTLCIGTGINYLIKGDVTLATTGLGSGLLLLFAATIDRFESLKGLGLEAKTKALNQTIDEANQTLILLRELAEISGRTLSSLVAKFGQPTFTVKESYELTQEIRKNLTSLKADKNSISRSLQPWVQGVSTELAFHLFKTFSDDYRVKVFNATERKVRDLHFDDPYRDSLVNLVVSVESHLHKGGINKWPAQDVLTNLREHVASAPEASDEFKAKHLAIINSWSDEVDFLLSHSDLKLPQRWFENVVR